MWGETTSEGYSEYLDFAGIQAKRVLASEDESDDGTFLENMTTVPDKYDAGGGLDSSSRLLIDDADRTPANTFCQNMGMRRIEARLPGQSEMDPGMSYGDKGLIAGLGTAQVQRVRTVRRASFAVTKGTVSTLRGKKTTIDAYASTQTLPVSAWEYDIKWIVPRFSDLASAPDDRVTKNAVTGTAANISFSGDLMTVEFTMKERTLSRPAPFDAPDFEDVINIGGGYVASDIAHTITNPGDGDGVQYFGDPERFVYPGDILAFDADDVRDVYLTCVSAKAFSGSADAAAVQPHADSPGVPEFVRDSYNKRDVAIFAMTPQNGEVIKDYVTGIGASEQDIPIDYVAHGAVAPPLIDANENSTGYAPVDRRASCRERV